MRDAAGQSQHCSVAQRVRGGGGPESASLNSLSGTGIIVFWVSLDALYFSRGLCGVGRRRSDVVERVPK